MVAFIDTTGSHDSGPWLIVAEPTGRTMSASLVLALEFDDDGLMRQLVALYCTTPR